VRSVLTVSQSRRKSLIPLVHRLPIPPSFNAQCHRKQRARALQAASAAPLVTAGAVRVAASLSLAQFYKWHIAFDVEMHGIWEAVSVSRVSEFGQGGVNVRGGRKEGHQLVDSA
jgi:hypothetical protein